MAGIEKHRNNRIMREIDAIDNYHSPLPMKKISAVEIHVPEEAAHKIGELIAKGSLSSGSEVQAFESNFARYCGASAAMACVNGTQALHAIWATFGVSAGTKILTTPFTFIASSNSILQANAEVVFADIDPRTYTLDPNAVEDKLKKDPQIRYILLVHLYGLLADIESFRFLQEKYGITIVEDCAQAHGASYKGQKAGTFFDAAAFSFYATKNIYCGEGGMCLFANPTDEERGRRIINHGRIGGYEHGEVGYNYRMSDLLAAIGNSVLGQIDELTQKRQENAKLYGQLLPEEVVLPHVPQQYEHVYHQFTITAPQRDSLQAYLAEQNIQANIVYPIPNYRQPIYQRLFPRLAQEDYPITDRLCTQVLSLPVHPYLNADDLRYVAEAITQFYNKA